MQQVRRVLAGALLTLAATGLCFVAGANAATTGFVYVITILLVTTWQGSVSGIAASVLATACLNYFFLPPIGTFHIADGQNWVSLACFLAATAIASRLMSRERERAAESRSRQAEIEALYTLCLDLFTAGAAPGGLEAATRRALATIGAAGGGLLIDEAWIGTQKDLEMHRLLGSAAELPPQPDDRTWHNVRIPVTVGGERAGALVAYGTRANRETLESVARLIGLALERERLLGEQARLEALKQSDSFKTALLQAVSHDLSTPLTAIQVSTESLRRALGREPLGREAVDLIATEAARLHRRIQNLLDLARLQAGSSRPRREPTPAADLFRSTRESLQTITAQRKVEAHVETGCPDLDVDPSLTLEILVNLVENAHRASTSGAPIEMLARHGPEGSRRVVLEVLDRGRGLARPPQESHGLGLEIARSFAAALDGSLELRSREGGGVCARLVLPAVPS